MKRLRVVIADPLVAVPGGDHDGRLFVQGRRDVRRVEDPLDLIGREHASRPRALAGRRPGAVLEGAAGGEARGALHCEAASVEPEPEVHPPRVDVVPPQELKSLVDLGEVCMGLGVGTQALYRAVPDTVCRNWMSAEPYSPNRAGGIMLTDVICHDVEEVDILLHIHNVEAT